MNASHKPGNRMALLKRLLRDQSGNTLAMVAAGVIPMIGIVGGTVDMGRGYMAKARMQQACDAAALSTRGIMTDTVITNADVAHGQRYFDFNFPAGSYGTYDLTRSVSQPVIDNVPQPVIRGTATASVPMTLMKVFGHEETVITVNCESRQEVSHADVAMVLDVTGSMTSNMKISSAGTATQSRITALRRAVRAFYDSLGPGRAAGDTSLGRIRYGFVPYGTVANVGYMLQKDQMVNSHVYSSRQPNNTTLYSWTEGSEVKAGYPAWSPATSPTPASVITASQITANYGTYNTSTTGTGTGTYSYTRLNLANQTIPRTVNVVPKLGGGTEPATSSNCFRANTYAAGSSNSSPGIVDVRRVASSTSETSVTLTPAAPVYPQASRLTKNYTNTETNATRALRYRWFNSSGNACRLEMATTGVAATSWTRALTTTGTKALTWRTHAPGTGFVYNERTVDVSALKPILGSAWNNTITVPNINVSGGIWENVKLSGRDKKTTNNTTTTEDWTQISVGGTATSGTVTWRGCVEERSTDTTISNSTPLTPIPTAAHDLNVAVAADTANDATRWRPWLPGLSFTPDAVGSSDECPSPAIRLQEFGSYTAGLLETSYPMLFDNTSGGSSSYYYPYSTTVARNVQSLENYIDRIPLVDGTIHDSGFIWGLHMVSGNGMFGTDNPSFFQGSVVSRNIVFMTDGDANPGPDRYVYTGLNNVDGRIAPKASTWNQMVQVQARRMRILCESAKAQGITVWVVVIKDGVSNDADLRACASSPAYFKSAATADELVSSFASIGQSIGGLRLTQ